MQPELATAKPSRICMQQLLVTVVVAQRYPSCVPGHEPAPRILAVNRERLLELGSPYSHLHCSEQVSDSDHCTTTRAFQPC